MDLIMRLPTLLPLYERLRGPGFQTPPTVVIGSKLRKRLRRRRTSKPLHTPFGLTMRRVRQARFNVLPAFSSRDVSIVGKANGPMSLCIKGDRTVLDADILLILVDAD